jgi:glutathione S-transferase
LVGEQDPRYKSNDERAHIDLKHMNERLLSNTWLAGDEFTAADVMMGWCFTTMRKFEPVDLTEYDGIKAWVDRVGEREAYRRAMGKADPELNIEEGLSVKGPKLVEAWAKVMGMKP